MNFPVDAQLPRSLTDRLRAAGHDALHTLDLPRKNRTSDSELVEIAERDQRVLVTKDADFVTTFLLSRNPRKLLLISTGNITNKDLEELLVPQIHSIASELESHDFVELTRSAMIIHM